MTTMSVKTIIVYQEQEKNPKRINEFTIHT